MLRESQLHRLLPNGRIESAADETPANNQSHSTSDPSQRIGLIPKKPKGRARLTRLRDRSEIQAAQARRRIEQGTRRRILPEAATGRKRAPPQYARSGPSDTLATSRCRRKRSRPTTNPAGMRGRLWSFALQRPAAGPAQTMPTTTNQNLETKERAEALSPWRAKLRQV